MGRFNSSISQAAKDVRSGIDTLVYKFERIETFFRRLEIYTEVPPNQEMVVTITDIMVETLFILAIVTEEIKQGRTSKYSTCCANVSPLTWIFSEKYLKMLVGSTDSETEDALKRLDNLTQEKVRMTAAQVAFLLLEHGLDVMAQSKDGDSETPLHLASREKNIEAVRMLLEYGADVTAQNKYGETPLHLAVREYESTSNVVFLLLRRGASVNIMNAQNKDGEAPLHLASREDKAEVARVLLGHGASLKTQNKDWETPLHLASREDKVEVAHVLLDHGADVTARNKTWETPLHLASREDNVEIVRVLLKCGADVMAQNNGGWNPFHLALSGGRVELVRIFMEHLASETTQRKDKWTPLCRAPPREYTKVAQMLFNHGADIIAQHGHRLTPLHLASGGHVKLALILLHHIEDTDWLGWSLRTHQGLHFT